jgi:hypothetical protein
VVFGELIILTVYNRMNPPSVVISYYQNIFAKVPIKYVPTITTYVPLSNAPNPMSHIGGEQSREAEGKSEFK